MKNGFILFLYSFISGALLTAFTHMEGIIRFVFSLATIFVAFQFFKRYESIPMRVIYIVVGVVLYFILSLTYSLIADANGWFYKRMETF